MHLRVSFSFSAVARLAVPPGKWFCLARTGLGYSQYSCCVCKAHHEVFAKHWNRLRFPDWKERLDASVDASLVELGYGDLAIMKERISALVYSKDSYLINPHFNELLSLTPDHVYILTDGPECLVRKVFPQISPSNVVTGKSILPLSQLGQLSDTHVGTNSSDLRVPQTKFLISRNKDLLVPPSVRVISRLTVEAMAEVMRVD